MKYLLLALLSLFSFEIFGQISQKVWVEFKDKAGSIYSLDRPEEFLSARAIERRTKYDIQLDESDLPVSEVYLDEIRRMGIKIHLTSKWMNGALVIADINDGDKLIKLPFVSDVKFVGNYHEPRMSSRIPKPIERKIDYSQKASNYGNAREQIQQINGEWLHKKGYRGAGKIVAVLDGGFTNVDRMPFFDSLRANERLLAGWDFVDNDSYPYEASSHGTQVMSTMASNLPGLMIGTAPEATYVCIRTEEVGSEMPVEEYNWVAGAEFADSLGADVINSSLGYTQFDNPQFSYTYRDMNGNTAVVTRGADLAASKGILVVNSAGNSGEDEWRYIGAPADGDDVFSIGAVDRYGTRSFFSSLGPTQDGRVKPNIAARGSSTVVASLYGYNTNYADGTSFSSPVIAGMVTSLWQAYPEKSNKEIIKAIEKSGSNHQSPDNKVGHGIPDFQKAYAILSEPPSRFDPDIATQDSAHVAAEHIDKSDSETEVEGPGASSIQGTMGNSSNGTTIISLQSSIIKTVKALVLKRNSAKP